MPERLANHLKERRTELGLTQAELADRVGVTRKTVNTVENGVFTPSTILALKLAEALDRRVEELFSLIEGCASDLRMRSPCVSCTSERCMPQPGRNMLIKPTSPPIRSVHFSPGRDWCGSTDSRAGRH